MEEHFPDSFEKVDFKVTHFQHFEFTGGLINALLLKNELKEVICRFSTEQSSNHIVRSVVLGTNDYYLKPL